MISLEDRVGLSGLTEEEVLAIAEHEHSPEIAALGQYLSRQERGIEQIRDMIVHDVRQAQQGQDKQHIVVLLHVLSADAVRSRQTTSPLNAVLCFGNHTYPFNM